MSRLLKAARRKLVAGLVTIAPIAITVFVIVKLFQLFDGIATPFLDRFLSVHVPGLGLIVTLVLVFLLGILVTNILGRRLIQWGELIVKRIPIAKTIYGTAKQIAQALGGTTSKAFQKTVLINYPHKDIWTLAFVTGESVDRDSIEYYHVFVSTTPNPTSGFMLIVPKKDAIDAHLSVEEGLKAIISGGMLAPGVNQIGSKEKEQTSPGS